MKDLRLQVLLARAGVASRRHAEAMILAGRVSVNGKVVTELGTRAHPALDTVTVDGEKVGASQQSATLMLHKPVSVMTTASDPQGRETVLDLVQKEPYRFVPVGRLDYHTEGLLLMSTDGELVNKLLHPKYHVPKVYQVKVRGAISTKAIRSLADGVKLDDGMTRPSVVEVVSSESRASWIEWS